MMKTKKQKFLCGVAIGLCGLAVTALVGLNAMANSPVMDSGVGHLCIGKMDFNFNTSNAHKNIWMADNEGLRLKGCTHRAFDFETAFQGERLVVAEMKDKKNAILGYTIDVNPKEAVESSVKRLAKMGFQPIPFKKSMKRNDTEAFALVRGRQMDLQLTGVPFKDGKNILVVIKTTGP
ncbi:MAG: hypothetical protein JXR76_12655 [Deltaproteobacteria bacterium]|nr:hypothetical protein [Deltaproteobacteria bacterium]